MLQYLIILLDDTSVSFCHAGNPLKERRLISIDTLKKGICFGMKENLMIHYVLPDYDLPEEYRSIMESIDNIKIHPSRNKPFYGFSIEGESDVSVMTSVPQTITSRNVVLRLSFDDAANQREQIGRLFQQSTRINICFTDVEHFDDSKIDAYKQMLEEWSQTIQEMFVRGRMPQFNLLTDRIMLSEMNNCNAGVSTITLAPNGKFYICPAFYYDEVKKVDNLLSYSDPSSDYSLGDVESGLSIPNRQLLSIDKAPLCRRCDAFQCKRCIWLNHKLTMDNNTPSRQQCIMAHIERNASMSLLDRIRKIDSTFMSNVTINGIDYLDPFEKIDN